MLSTRLESIARRLGLHLFLLTPLLLTPFTALAHHWVVDQDGFGDFITIQSAIDAAQTGDEIEVRAGVYEEYLNYIGKEIQVYSTSGHSSTHIRPPSNDDRNDHTVTFELGEGPGAILEGFSLVEGEGREMPILGARSGGAIGCYGSDPVLRDCQFLGNAAVYGGAIALDHSNPLIEDCTFIENTVTHSGSAIAGPNSAPIILNCFFGDNEAPTGFGTIHIGLPAEITGCTFFDNQAYGGGAIDCYEEAADMYISHCLFWANAALTLHGGAIRIHEADPVIEYCTFIDNRSNTDGGALMIQDHADPYVHHCTFYANIAIRSGANLAVWDFSSPRVEHCIMAEGLDGYGVFVDNASPTFVCTCSWNNRPDNYLVWPDPTGTEGNITVDPLFCNEAGLEFTLHASSECAAENNPECGQIGRYGVNCGTTPAIKSSWGRVKTLFRSAR